MKMCHAPFQITTNLERNHVLSAETGPKSLILGVGRSAESVFGHRERSRDSGRSKVCDLSLNFRLINREKSRAENVTSLILHIILVLLSAEGDFFNLDGSL